VSAGSFRIEIPAVPEHLGTARAFVAAVAHEVEASEETVADLKLATSEACTIALSSGQPIRLRVFPTEAALEVRVDLHGAGDGPPDDEDVERREVIASLFPDAAILTEPDTGAVLRFSAPLR